MASSEQLETVANHLADNLRAARSQRGFTQARLAHLAEIPRSTLASIEAGGANPTLAVIIRLAAALRLSLEELVSAPRARYQHFRAEELPTARPARTRAEVTKLLPHGLPGLEAERLRLKAGARLTGTPHRAGTQEYLFCEHGQITLFVAGERIEVTKGELAAFAGDQAHGYHNRGQVEAVGFSVITVRSAPL